MNSIFLKWNPFFLLFLLISITHSSINAQEVIVLKDKLRKADCVIRVGKKLKIKTEIDEKFNGELKSIQDSSLTVMTLQAELIEIPIKDIKTMYVRSGNGWKTAVGIFLGAASIEMTVLLALQANSYHKAKQNSQQYPGDLVASEIGIGVISGFVLPALYTGTYFAFFYRKKYDVKNRYELIILK